MLELLFVWVYCDFAVVSELHNDMWYVKLWDLGLIMLV